MLPLDIFYLPLLTSNYAIFFYFDNDAWNTGKSNIYSDKTIYLGITGSASQLGLLDATLLQTH